MTEDDLGILQSAVENLRAPERTAGTVEAAWQIAYKLDDLAKRAEAARRQFEADVEASHNDRQG